MAFEVQPTAVEWIRPVQEGEKPHLTYSGITYSFEPDDHYEGKRVVFIRNGSAINCARAFPRLVRVYRPEEPANLERAFWYRVRKQAAAVMAALNDTTFMASDPKPKEVPPEKMADMPPEAASEAPVAEGDPKPPVEAREILADMLPEDDEETGVTPDAGDEDDGTGSAGQGVS